MGDEVIGRRNQKIVERNQGEPEQQLDSHPAIRRPVRQPRRGNRLSQLILRQDAHAEILVMMWSNRGDALLVSQQRVISCRRRIVICPPLRRYDKTAT